MNEPLEPVLTHEERQKRNRAFFEARQQERINRPPEEKQMRRLWIQVDECRHFVNDSPHTPKCPAAGTFEVGREDCTCFRDQILAFEKSPLPTPDIK